MRRPPRDRVTVMRRASGRDGERAVRASSLAGRSMDSSAKSAASTKHVVIVGAGFAGLNCAKKLASDSSLRITLIDKNNYQQFQPLFLSAGSEANFFSISGANKNAFPMYSLRDAEHLRSRLLELFEAADV